MLEFDLIIYHYACPDGIMGLWSAYHYLKIPFEKIGMCAGKDPYGTFENKKILFIDVCPSKNFILVNTKLATSITILDHHKSAYDEYTRNKSIYDSIDNLVCIFDMDRAGCQIAWDYLFESKERPWFINYIADRDLWLWKLPHAKEITEALEFNEYIDETDLSKIDSLLNVKPDTFIKEGAQILKIKNKIMINEFKNAHEAIFNFKKKKYRVWSCSIIFQFRSEFGNKLINIPFSDFKLPDFCVIWSYNLKENTWFVSLRGSDSSPDLSVIAKHFNGGGHLKAAAFKLNNGKNLTDIISIL